MTRFFLVRHAETASNAEGRTQGRREVPLNERGRLQAAALARALGETPLAAIISSPSGRALATAHAIAAEQGLDVRTDERLHELDQGMLDGLTSAELRDGYAAFLKRWREEDPAHLRMPGGETLAEAQARMVAAAAESARAFPDAGVALVSHNLALKALLCHALGVPLATFRTLAFDVAAIAVVDVVVRDDALSSEVVTMNDRSHLEAMSAGSPAPEGAGSERD